MTKSTPGYVTIRCEYHPRRRQLLFTSFSFHASGAKAKNELRAQLDQALGIAGWPLTRASRRRVAGA